MAIALTNSICITVYKEGDSISELLKSLLNQKAKPNEIVVCDGGSTDDTVRIIKELQKKHKQSLPLRGKQIKLYISPGPVAHGRNVAIKHAKGEIIVCIDAGCIAKKDWLEKLLKPFDDPSVDIVAGFYEMKYKTPFQKVMALYRGTHPKRFDNTFMPSCRSVAFKRSVWKELGGFNEMLSLSGEDTQFFYRALQKGKRIVRVKNALVEWKEPEQFGFKDFKKFFYYARGDAQAGIWWHPLQKWRTHNVKILSIFARYVILLSLLLLSFYNYMFAILFLMTFVFYVAWSIQKWSDSNLKFNEMKWVPIMQIGTDIIIMSGFLTGILNNNLKR